MRETAENSTQACGKAATLLADGDGEALLERGSVAQMLKRKIWSRATVALSLSLPIESPGERGDVGVAKRRSWMGLKRRDKRFVLAESNKSQL